MATIVVKSEMDAAQALLDLQGDHRDMHHDYYERKPRVESIEGSTTIAKILSSFIGTKAMQRPQTSTPKQAKILPNRWNEPPKERYNSRNVPRKEKKMCNKSTQTDFDFNLPEIEKMECIIKELCAKIETLESKLKSKDDTPSAIDSCERISDTSSDEYSEADYKRKSYKRKRNLTATTDFSYNGDYETSYADSSKKRCAEYSDNTFESPKVTKKPLKPKNNYRCNNEMVSIGDGNACVPIRLLKQMDWSSYTNATRKLLTAVFSRKVLATHSLTGKPSPAFPDKPAKKKLDPALVNDIVQTVVEKCNVPENVVRTSITTKCADESKMFRTREQNKKKRKSIRKENISPDSDESYVSD